MHGIDAAYVSRCGRVTGEPRKSGWTNRDVVRKKADSSGQKNRVLDGDARWSHRARTIKTFCAQWTRVVCVCVCVCACADLYTAHDKGAEYCDDRVCLCVCLPASISAELHVRSSPNFYACYLRPWLGPSLAALRYIMYFRFYKWRNFCTLWPGRIGDAVPTQQGAAWIWHRGVYSNWPTSGQHRTGGESDQCDCLVTVKGKR